MPAIIVIVRPAWRYDRAVNNIAMYTDGVAGRDMDASVVEMLEYKI